MTLTLSVDRPGGGAPPALVLNGRDAVIGRGPDVDWALPDPAVSSRHCEIGFRHGVYLIRDTSSNGTTVNGQRLSAIHRLASGDVLGIGGFTVKVQEGEAPTSAAILGGDALVAALASAVATLLATRGRQLHELGVTAPDRLRANPLCGDPGTAGERLRALPPAAAQAAVAEAVDAVERHHAASVAAMAVSLRQVLAEVAPDAIAAEASGRGDARDAASWRRYVARFTGDGGGEAGFVDRFARAFRQSYEQVAVERR